jgi:hypothetical protein
MKYINEIDKDKKRDKVILIGRGPSADNLNLDVINSQKEYDICTISDAMKIIDHPTYAFHYHWTSVRRCQAYLKKPAYSLINSNAIKDITEKAIEDLLGLEKFKNTYLFKSVHRKLPQIINEHFEKKVDKTLYNHSGSVVGAVNFLCGYMGYKEIKYIGFDGGLIYGMAQYGSKIGNSRKESKVKGSINKYYESWQGTMEILKFYPDVEFEQLKEYLK